jgi:uncharacterized cupredoxin-like copper-binding protein
MRHWKSSLLVVAALASVAAIGCGGDDDGDGDGATSAAADTESTGAASAGLTIKMGDFFFDPNEATASSGTVEITAPNVGQTEHELVLFASDADPASLPVKGGEVDEAAFEKTGAVNAGEIEEVLPGESKSGSFDLNPGRYVMICNLPGHYSQGMYGSLTAN